MTDNLQNLLDFLDETWVVHRFGELDVSKVARTFTHRLSAGLALELAIDRTKKRVIKTAITRLDLVLLHGLWVKNVRNTHILDLLGGHQAELNLLHRLERRARVGEVEVRHICGVEVGRGYENST